MSSTWLSLDNVSPSAVSACTMILSLITNKTIEYLSSPMEIEWIEERTSERARARKNKRTRESGRHLASFCSPFSHCLMTCKKIIEGWCEVLSMFFFLLKSLHKISDIERWFAEGTWLKLIIEKCGQLSVSSEHQSKPTYILPELAITSYSTGWHFWFLWFLYSSGATLATRLAEGAMFASQHQPCATYLK